MFRPLCVIRRKIYVEKHIVRSKVIQPSSILKPAEKIKLHNKENKELFGPLLETNKQRKAKLRKEAKNRSNQNNETTTSNKSTQNFIDLRQHVVVSSPKASFDCYAIFREINQSIDCVLKSVKTMNGNMWTNTRTCYNFVRVLLNGSQVRCLTTASVSNTAQSSPAQPGYAGEDKILQIRQHQNDFTQQFPSVTLILNKTMTEESKKTLEKWKQERIAEMGLDEFNRFHQAQLAVGTKFHNTLKTYFTQPLTQLRIEKDVEGVWVSVADVLKNISTPKAIESNVIHPVLKYRGIFDAIADYEEKPTLIEWKKSDKPRKSITMTYDNPVQLAAYFGAVCNDLNYKHFNIRDALLVIAYTDGSKADIFHLSTDKLREHWAQWLIRLEEYMGKYGQDSNKRLEGGKRMFEEQIGNL